MKPPGATHRSHEIGSIRALAANNAKAYLWHPIHLAGIALLAIGIVVNAATDGRSGPIWDHPLTTDLYLGIGGIFVGASLARREVALAPLAASSPSTSERRRLSLLIACAVPAISASVILASGWLVERGQSPLSDRSSLRPSTGPITTPEYLAWLIELGPVAAFGGAALGVALGHRLRRPGSVGGAALLLVLLEVVALGAGEEVPGIGESWGARIVANAMPFAYWQADVSPDASGTLAMRPGSPIGHLLYAASLCCLVAAYESLGARRHRATRRAVMTVISAAAIVGYAWAVLG